MSTSYTEIVELWESESSQSGSLCFHHDCESGLWEGGQGYRSEKKMLRELSHFFVSHWPGGCPRTVECGQHALVLLMAIEKLCVV